MKKLFHKKSDEQTNELKYKRSVGQSKIQLNGGIMLLVAGLLILISVAVSFFVASRIYSARLQKQTANKVIFDLETTDAFQVAKLQDVIDFIESQFGLDYDMNLLLEGAIEGIMDALDDPYSYYIGPGEYDSYEASVSGVYPGIGIEYIQNERGFEITRVYADTPAEEVGLLVGETIISLDGIEISALSDEDISEKLSTPDTTVELTVDSVEDVRRVVSVTVRQIIQSSVYYRDQQDDIRYIRIEKFDDDTGTEFSYALEQAEKDGVKGLIIDLRGNRGGYEREATKVADLLLGEGLIAYAEDRNGDRITEISSDKECTELPVVMLADGNSASASELVLGAFRDFDRGIIVGTKTYGKALGQLSRSYPEDGSGVVLTVSRYFTPSGECIHGVGITPDVIAEAAEAYVGKLPEDIPEAEDVQLQQALATMMELIG